MEVVVPPLGRATVSCKWLFKLKLDQKNNLARYKARLVARGFSQKQGIDYEETFNPVVKGTTIRIVLAFAQRNGFLLTHMDVDTAFLYGKLGEEIYMEQPDGMNLNGNVLRFNKTIYGLKQSPRIWYQTLSDYLCKCGYTENLVHTCLFAQNDKEGKVTSLIFVYVDDLLIATINSSKANQ